MKTDNETVSIPGHVCTIKNTRLANGVLVALVAISIAASIWLVSVMLAGPWLAYTLLVEGTVATITVLTGVLLARSLSESSVGPRPVSHTAMPLHLRPRPVLDAVRARTEDRWLTWLRPMALVPLRPKQL